MPISALSAVAGIIFAVAIEKGQQTDWALAWVIAAFAMQPVSWWWTLAYQRQSARRRDKLLQILTDLKR